MQSSAKKYETYKKAKMWHGCDIFVVCLEIVLEHMCLRLSLTSHYSHTCILKAFSRKAITKTMIKYYILYTLYFWILPKLWICMCIKLDVWTYTFFISRAHDTICSPPFRLGLLEINLQSTPSLESAESRFQHLYPGQWQQKVWRIDPAKANNWRS